jgi:signal transduction histidine kinase
MGARMIFNYNMDMALNQASDEVHLLSHTIVKDIESLPFYEQMDDNIVYRVGVPYINYISSKDPNAVLEIRYVCEKGELQMGVQEATVYDAGSYPEIRVLELLEAPYEAYMLNYREPLDDFYSLWQSLKWVFAFISLCCSFVLAAVLYFLLYEMTAPLQRLSESVKLMHRGEPWKEVTVQGYDDIAELTKSFNEMGHEIDAQLLQLQKESTTKQQLVDDLAHEMRTPLTSIHGYAEYLLNAAVDEEERIDALLCIMSESERLGKLSQSLLDISYANNAPIVKTSVAVEDIFDSIEKRFEMKVSSLGVELSMKTDAAHVNGDGALLELLFSNLTDNAIKACRDSQIKKVSVVMTEDVGCAVLTVKDTGRGMTEDEIHHITEPFYRTDRARSRADGGAGLGLALCRRIVDAHSGEMEFSSKLGEGTTVTVILKN